MNIVIEELLQEDIPELIAWINSEPAEHFYQWGGAGAGFFYPLDTDQFEVHFKTAQIENPIRKLYKAVSEGRMVGYIELNHINRVHKNAVVSRVIVNKAFQGCGIGYQMVKEIASIAFNGYQLHRLSLGVFDFNSRAIKCYERVGFMQEGITRENVKVGDSYWNSVQMSILDKEWNKRT